LGDRQLSVDDLAPIEIRGAYENQGVLFVHAGVDLGLIVTRDAQGNPVAVAKDARPKEIAEILQQQLLEGRYEDGLDHCLWNRDLAKGQPEFIQVVGHTTGDEVRVNNGSIVNVDIAQYETGRRGYAELSGRTIKAVDMRHDTDRLQPGMTVRFTRDGQVRKFLYISNYGKSGGLFVESTPYGYKFVNISTLDMRETFHSWSPAKPQNQEFASFAGNVFDKTRALPGGDFMAIASRALETALIGRGQTIGGRRVDGLRTGEWLDSELKKAEASERLGTDELRFIGSGSYALAYEAEGVVYKKAKPGAESRTVGKAGRDVELSKALGADLAAENWQINEQWQAQEIAMPMNYRISEMTSRMLLDLKAAKTPETREKILKSYQVSMRACPFCPADVAE
jgi:hypothetical protein